MKAMKLRLLPMGCIITAIGAGLFAARGFSTSYVGLALVGVVLLALGLIWK